MAKIETIRHSLAHIMAYAVQELYPAAPKGRASLNEIERGVKFGIGPVIENGFYYDFEFVDYNPPTASSRLRRAPADQRGSLPQHQSKARYGAQHGSTPNQKLRFGTGQARISTGDLPKVEQKMKELIKQDIAFKKKLISKTEAEKIFQKQPYKLELINEIRENKVSIYESGKFLDLCQGPHVKSTKEIPSGSFRLTKIAGAYWRGSERNPMLTRIYGVAFASKKELDNYLQKMEDAEKRDHRVLGQKLNLFSLDEEVGAGLPLFHPMGAVLKEIIEDFVTKEVSQAGYQLVHTPHIAKESLFQTSGHLDFYQENMYSPFEIDKERYYVKPMNCPFHIKIYQSELRSYKDLPIRFAEVGEVYRYEKSGVLHGLVRVRGFTIDDAHIWCSPDQLGKEIIKISKEAEKILRAFGFKEFDVYLSTRPKKYIGTPKLWEKGERSLKFALHKVKLKYKTDLGGGAFYGPKIDIKIKDSLGRPWQCTTLQVDFNLPEKFDLHFINRKGKKQRPIMLHRALLGSIERFMGVLLEHYGGALPLWLAPTQIWIIPVGSRHKKYAQQTTTKLKEAGARCELRDTAETVSKKIRGGELQKIPYLLVVGDKEVKSKGVRVRERGKGDIGMMKLSRFTTKLNKEIETKK